MTSMLCLRPAPKKAPCEAPPAKLYMIHCAWPSSAAACSSDLGLWPSLSKIVQRSFAHARQW